MPTLEGSGIGGALGDLETGVLEADNRLGSVRSGLGIDAVIPDAFWAGMKFFGEAVAGGSCLEDLSLRRGRSLSALRFSGATDTEVVDDFGSSPFICARRSPIYSQ